MLDLVTIFPSGLYLLLSARHLSHGVQNRSISINVYLAGADPAQEVPYI